MDLNVSLKISEPKNVINYLNILAPWNKVLEHLF